MTSISVMEISEICGVARSTVSYWIAKKSLPAVRNGKRHMVEADDLALFLRSQGRQAPSALLDLLGGNHAQPFITHKKCWEYWANTDHGQACRSCPVFIRPIQPCFMARDHALHRCPHDCIRCRYFRDFWKPQTAFVHQIDKPAAIFQPWRFWAGNRLWESVSGRAMNDIPGSGIEKALHPDSLQSFMSYFQRVAQEDPTAPKTNDVIFFNPKSAEDAGNRARLYMMPLRRPPGTWLMVAEPIRWAQEKAP